MAGWLVRPCTKFGDRWWRDPLGRFAWNGVAREIALTESWGDGADTVRQAGLALSRDPPRRIALEGTRAVGEALAGRPVDALRVAAGVRGAVAVENMTILHAELATAEGLAHREMGDRSRALVELEALAEAPAETTLYCKVLATVELAAAHLDAGDLAAARRSFSQAETLIEKESFGPDGRMWLARTGTRMALSGGDIESGRSWAVQIDDAFGGLRPPHGCSSLWETPPAPSQPWRWPSRAALATRSCSACFEPKAQTTAKTP